MEKELKPERRTPQQALGGTDTKGENAARGTRKTKQAVKTIRKKTSRNAGKAAPGQPRDCQRRTRSMEDNRRRGKSEEQLEAQDAEKPGRRPYRTGRVTTD